MFSNIISFPLILLRCVGIWEDSIERYIPLAIYKLYRFCIRYIFVYMSVICESVHLKVFKSFEMFCDNFSIATSIFNIFVKMFTFNSMINEVYKFKYDMDSSIFLPRNNTEQRMFNTMEKYVKSINRFWFVSITATSFTAPAVPIFQNQRVLPLHFWYPLPFNMDNDYIFYPLFMQQAISSIVLGQIAAATGTFIFSTLLYFSYQIKLLGYRFSQCGYNTNNHKYTEFIDCVKMHTEIEDLVEKFHQIFNSALFIQIGQSVLVYSMLTVLMTTMELDSTAFVSKSCHLAAMIFEMAVLCFYCNEISYESQELSWQAYHSNFVDSDYRIGQILTIFIQAAQRHPIVIRANGIFTFQLNLGLFLSILRNTYSYVVLISQLT